MSSTLDELEQIERSARAGPDKEDRRRGSSMFSGPGAVMNYKNSKGGSKKSEQLLEDFPRRDPKQSGGTNNQFFSQPSPAKAVENKPRPGGVAIKRGSVALKPMSGLGGLVDFDDSDFDDSDEDEAYSNSRTPGKNAVGGPNCRPLVGGFAAAAYEAARAHHYSNMSKGQPTQSKRRGPPPSI
mmetsp:Transcript_30764/g.35082  ORF Transcript_30764/g.35082 Transcript_30764/m.35082 type:complete len:183 (+) Transcript_30764:175-723(+)|eukprot:CAMPEP_0194145644 /NCGR_PEP_ID=MMETSP0152-20130528/18099_1 /TAXON_ID=1049557 /ORGANISM="Thalassiothrix antarctica, Strain L6-D1" /LENGTH=182 /DNA_ID=CAMNT_0038845927 /DNA_START=111 /DNA_END=659 /DNA_ORIENTATION=+